MGSDTSKFSLDAISFGVFDCPHSTPRLSDEGPFMARTQDIRKGYFDTSVAVRVDEEVYAERTKRVEPAFGDVLFSREGTYFGDAAEVPKHMRVCLGQRMVLIRPNPEIIRPSYLRMQINSAYFQAMLRQYRDGTVAERLNLPVIRSLKISVPPLPEQDFVIRNISPLEKKIELNRQISTTLEAMAQTLFKSWFVDFDPVIDNALAAGNPIPDELADRAERRAQATQQPSPEQPHTLPTHIRQQFPDRFVFTEEMGWVPEGWPIKDVGAVLELAYGKSLSANKRIAGDVPVYGSGGVTGSHNEKLVNGPGIVVGRKGTVGSLYWVENAFYPIDTVFYVVVKAEIPLYWLFQSLQLMDIKSMGADSAVPGVNRNVIYAKNISIPSAALFKHYLDQISPINAERQALSAQSTTLRNLRDTLLPKLLSGQLRIPEAEQLLAEAL